MEFFITGLGAGNYGNEGIPLKKENLWQRPDERHYGRPLENIDELINIPFKEIVPFERHYIKNAKIECVFDNTILEGDYKPLDKEGEYGFWIKKTPEIPEIPEFPEQVQPDWNEDNTESPGFIKNKPEIEAQESPILRQQQVTLPVNQWQLQGGAYFLILPSPYFAFNSVIEIIPSFNPEYDLQVFLDAEIHPNHPVLEFPPGSSEYAAGFQAKNLPTADIEVDVLIKKVTDVGGG